MFRCIAALCVSILIHEAHGTSGTQQPDKVNQLGSDYSNASSFLANERTYLAWIRTALAMMSIGFGAAKLSGTSITAIVLSVFALIMGGVLGGFATWRYFAVISYLQESKFEPDKFGPVIMSTFLAISALAFTTWILYDNVSIFSCCQSTSTTTKPTNGVARRQMRQSFRDQEDEADGVAYLCRLYEELYGATGKEGVPQKQWESARSIIQNDPRIAG